MKYFLYFVYFSLNIFLGIWRFQTSTFLSLLTCQFQFPVLPLKENTYSRIDWFEVGEIYLQRNCEISPEYLKTENPEQ